MLAKEKELNLSEAARGAVFDTAAKNLADSDEAQEALTSLSETQAKARISSITSNFLNYYAEGQVINFLELYQAIDNESSWKRNVPASENLAEFKSALLEHIAQKEDSDKLHIDKYAEVVELFAKGLTPFLRMRERADYTKLVHLLAVYNTYKKKEK